LNFRRQERQEEGGEDHTSTTKGKKKQMTIADMLGSRSNHKSPRIREVVVQLKQTTSMTAGHLAATANSDDVEEQFRTILVRNGRIRQQSYVAQSDTQTLSVFVCLTDNVCVSTRLR
jgi:hypothetical protein